LRTEKNSSGENNTVSRYRADSKNHTELPAIPRRQTRPALTQAKQVGTRFTGRMEG